MKPKSKKKTYNEPDSSSDSDAPLVELRPLSIKNDKDNLFKYSVEKCEFCDKIFNNKYNMLVHNAKHIIIPLLNQKVHKCTQCHRLFNSIESLEWHSVNSHARISDNKDYLPKILQSFVQRQPVTVLTKEPLFSIDTTVSEPRVNGDHNNVPEILKSMVLKLPVTVLTKLKDPIVTNVNDSIIESLVKKEPVTLVKNEKFVFEDDEKIFNDNEEIFNDDDTKDDTKVFNAADEINDNADDFNASDNDKDDVFSISDSDITVSDSEEDEERNDGELYIKTETAFEYVDVGSDCDVKKPPIKDRIMFEDDNGDIDISKLAIENTSFTKSLLNFENDLELYKVKRKNAIIIGNKPNGTKGVERTPLDTTRSVHYDELKKPGLFRCKKCSDMFPNRLAAIVHETSHLRFRRKPAFLCHTCDWYVASNPGHLIRHRKLKHPELKNQNNRRKLRTCPECNLAFRHKTLHRQNYHQEYQCRKCKEVFPTRKQRYIHKYQTHKKITETKTSTNVTWKLSTLKVCDFCSEWLKDRSNLKYQFVKNFSKLGERVQCDRCEKLAFELKVVTMMRKRIVKCENSKEGERRKRVCSEKKAKKMTNTDRLKNVQQRLKQLKLRNKF